MVQISEINLGNPGDFCVNKVSSQGIHYSRYIASWAKEGGNFLGYYERLEHDGKIRERSPFCQWLASLGLNEEEIYEIWKMAASGKMELESSAMRFMRGYRY